MDSVIVWTGSEFAEWDYYKVKERGIPDYAREATREESALYREFAAALRASAEREQELIAVIRTYACDCQPGCCETGSYEDTICGARAARALGENKDG